jgi:hypothetical protein
MSIKCRRCQYENPDDTRFCGNCAAPLHTTTKCYLIATLVLALMMQGCREREYRDRSHTAQPRDRLMLTELMGSEYQGAAPLDNRYFMPMGTWEAAKHGFEGTLTVPEFVMLNPEENNSADSWDYFPGFTVDLFSDGKSLVPVSREIALKLSDRSYWRIMISPGTVWFEPEDGGMSRASFPFTLVNDLFNDVHNGLATFVYDETRVSSLFLQATQETSPVYKADFWGVTTMRYTPHPLENKNYLAARFAEEERR